MPEEEAMHERYTKEAIHRIWSDEHKLELWQRTEFAVLKARAKLGKLSDEICREMINILAANPIDITWWKNQDKKIGHDLNAFLDERVRFLPEKFHPYWHEKITSYDTEEPAFGRMLLESLNVVYSKAELLEAVLIESASKYRYTIMNARTHGQESELQTFGKRILTWLAALRVSVSGLRSSAENLKYSKLSGASGNYGASIDPELEEKALAILGFQPLYGATQIVPREIYTPVASALCQLVQTMAKIAEDIRLGARSGRPIYQEPFGKKQKGSSAMPHKKNTIFSEQIIGLGRLAEGYHVMLMKNIVTQEERAIEQSCVERVAWPDLFHVVVHALERTNKIISGLVVYPDNMLLEIVESRGCYASSEAKEFLKKEGAQFGLAYEDAYRIIQLAAFNAFAPSKRVAEIRERTAVSFGEAELFIGEMEEIHKTRQVVSIQDLISDGKLFPLPDQLAADEALVGRWNGILREMFADANVRHRWSEIFTPRYLLQNEKTLFQKIFGEK